MKNYSKYKINKRLIILLLILLPVVSDTGCASKKKGIRRGKAIPCPFKDC